MSAPDSTRPGFSLRRWSERKLAASRAAAPVPPAETATGIAGGESPAPAAVAPAAAVPASAAPAPAQASLPAVESLTFDSDFTAFLRPEVDESMRRGALRRLFRDPRFNVMDGLDTYIDDYGRPDPIPPEIVRQLVQARYLLDPPRTRVNEAGEVEDVPPEDVASGAVPAAPPDAAGALPVSDADRPPGVAPAVAGSVAVAVTAGAASPPADGSDDAGTGGVRRAGDDR